MTYQLVPSDKSFRFKNLCPYCKSDLIYQARAWSKSNFGMWLADEFDIDCVSMPDFEDSAWRDWFNEHSQYPYIYQMPIDEQVKEFINKRYRFIMD